MGRKAENITVVKGKEVDDPAYNKQVTKRFLQIMDHVLANKAVYNVRSARAFCSTVKINPANIYSLTNTLTNKSRSVTIDQCVLLCMKYNVNAGWLLLGTGSKFSDPINTSLEQKLSVRLLEIARELLGKDL